MQAILKALMLAAAITATMSPATAQTHKLEPSPDRAERFGVEYRVAPGELDRVELILRSTDGITYARAIILIAGNTDRTGARFELETSRASPRDPYFVSVRLHEGFAYVYVMPPLNEPESEEATPQESGAAATNAQTKNRRDEDRSTPITMKRETRETGNVNLMSNGAECPSVFLPHNGKEKFPSDTPASIELREIPDSSDINIRDARPYFPVLFVRSIEAGAPGTQLIMQVPDPDDRTVGSGQDTEDVRMFFIEGEHGVAARFSNESRVVHLNDKQRFQSFRTASKPEGPGERPAECREVKDKQEFLDRAKAIARAECIPVPDTKE